MDHAPRRERLKDNIPDIIRFGSEDSRTGDNNLFAHPQQQMRIHIQMRINQVKVLYNHTLFAANRFHNCCSQFVGLIEGHFEADIDMISMGCEKACIVQMHEGQGPDINSFIVIGQFQSGKHTFNQNTLTRSTLPDHANQTIIGRKIHLSNLSALVRQACCPPRAQ